VAESPPGSEASPGSQASRRSQDLDDNGDGPAGDGRDGDLDDDRDRDADDDDERLAAYAAALADAVEAALPGWVERVVAQRMIAWSGCVPEAVATSAAAAGREARDAVAPRLRRLLATDVDDQRSTPLTIVRQAVPYATDVLARACVPAVVRDGVAERAFPDDVYDLAPVTLGDVQPDLVEPGLTWGAAKAHVVLARRRAEGRR
jgi:hypothetical protein